MKMKSIYLQEAVAEKMRPISDSNYVKRMHIMADREKVLSFSVFKDTGRLMDVKQFEECYGEKAHQDALHVMTYIGGVYVQLLKNGTWWTEEKEHTNLLVVEQKLYKNFTQNLDDK
jgi:hypothetical protein